MSGGMEPTTPGSAPNDRSPSHGFTVLPVTGIGEVTEADDLADLLIKAASWLADGDVLLVTSKIVSKAEGRLVRLPATGRAAAARALLDAETAGLVAARGRTRIVRTGTGLVMASAGIDASNVDQRYLALLPVDPDASARRLRSTIAERYGLDVAVIITDTMGRPWRVGLVDVAIGVAGLEPLLDLRERTDSYGNRLGVTITAVADELAAAAELVKGKLDGVPAAVIRGWSPAAQRMDPVGPAPDGPGAAAMVRTAQEDMFSLGTDLALARGMAAAARLPEPPAFTAQPVAPARLTLAINHAGGDAQVLPVAVAAARGIGPVPAGTAAVLVVPQPDTGDEYLACAEVGATLTRLRAALASVGVASVWVRGNTWTGTPRPGVLAVGMTAEPGCGDPAQSGSDVVGVPACAQFVDDPLDVLGAFARADQHGVWRVDDDQVAHPDGRDDPAAGRHDDDIV